MSAPDSVETPATRMYRQRPETVADDRGSGPTVVFSHGTLMDRTMFDPQLDTLAGDYRTVAYNHRARTEHAHEPYDLDDLVTDCRTLLDAKSIDSCVLAGMSMGGFMALRFALTHPEMLEGLVLIDSMAVPHTEAEQNEYGGLIDQARTDGVTADLVEIVSHLLFGETTIAERPELVEHWGDRWRSYPGEAVYHEVRSWLHRPGVVDRLDEIGVPTLILHGEEDAAIDIERAAPMVESLPAARMERIPKAGHSSNLENPEAANAAIREFLQDVY
jgi:pimeloyl-ACP methyl ester carboxylesterase